MPLTEVSDEPGDPTEFIEGCDLSEVVPFVGSAETGVVADGVKRAPLLEPDMVVECCVDNGGRLSRLDPAEYVADGDFGLKNVLPFFKLNPPPPLRFLSDGEGEAAVSGSSPNSDSDMGKPLVLDEGFRWIDFDGVVPDGLRNTLSR